MANNTRDIQVSGDSAPLTTTVRAVVSVFFISMILFGNTLTILAVIKEECLRKIGNSFIVSLAVADLLTAVVILFYTFNTYGGWLVGDVLCIIYSGSYLALITASILSITCISIDRYIAITDPLRYTTRMTRKVAGCLICCVWIISGLLSYVPIIVCEIFNVPFLETTDNNCYFSLSSPAMMVYIIIAWFVPGLMMLSAYGVIFKVARKQEAQVHQLAEMASNLHNEPNDIHRSSPQRNHKAVKTVGLITGIFLVCWLPIFIVLSLAFVYPNISLYIPRAVFDILPWLVYSNSMLNPFIYAACNRNFRRALKKILCKARWR